MNTLRAILCAAAMAAMSVPAVAGAGPADPAAPVANKANKGDKARKARSARRARTPREARAKRPRVKNYDFLGDELRGDLISPEMEDVRGRVGAKHTSLIQVRQDFVREIGKAAEDL